MMIRDSDNNKDMMIFITMSTYKYECYSFIYYEVPHFDNFIILNTFQTFSIQYK